MINLPKTFTLNNRKDGEYKLFHDTIADLNPNMKIEHISTLNSVPIDNRLNSAPADSKLKCTTEDLYELNRKQREINLKKYNDKKVKKFY